MSDALSDIARDEQRHTAFGRYLVALADWCEASSAETIEAVRAAAEESDVVRGGYGSSPTRLVARLNKTMEALAERDERAWVRLLLIAADFPDIAQRIRALSPFAGKVLMLADYGLGLGHFRGDFESAVAEKVLAAGGVPYAGEDYVKIGRAHV